MKILIQSLTLRAQYSPWGADRGQPVTHQPSTDFSSVTISVTDVPPWGHHPLKPRTAAHSSCLWRHYLIYVTRWRSRRATRARPLVRFNPSFFFRRLHLSFLSEIKKLNEGVCALLQPGLRVIAVIQHELRVARNQLLPVQLRPAALSSSSYLQHNCFSSGTDVNHANKIQTNTGCMLEEKWTSEINSERFSVLFALDTHCIIALTQFHWSLVGDMGVPADAVKKTAAT